MSVNTKECKPYVIQFMNYDENNVPLIIGERHCFCDEVPTLERVRNYFEDKVHFSFEDIGVEEDYDTICEILDYGDRIPEI